MKGHLVVAKVASKRAGHFPAEIRKRLGISYCTGVDFKVIDGEVALNL